MKTISSTNLCFITLQLSEDESKQIAVLAENLGISPDDVLKQAVDFFCVKGVKHLSKKSSCA